MNKTQNNGVSLNRAGVRGPAWRAAEEAGVDVSLIEASLAKTPWERLQAHDDALALVIELREAMSKHHHA